MDKKKKMKIGIIVGVVVIVILLITVIVLATRKPKGASSANKGKKKMMESICDVTDYKNTCNSSMAAAGGENVKNPQDFIKLGFNVSRMSVENITKHIKDFEGKFPGSSEEFKMCKELLKGSIFDLQNSYERIANGDKEHANVLLSDLKAWLSGAITYKDTCLDALTGEAKKMMNERMNVSSELMSNSLAMVTEISHIFQQQLPSLSALIGGRKLLEEEDSDDIPWWVDSTSRRLLQAAPGKVKADVVVAQDGSGKFKTINEALKVIPPNGKKTFVIHIKEGVYKEIVNLGKQMTGVMLMGDGPTKTKITGDNSVGLKGMNTFQTATVASDGERFIVKDITIENTAGPEGHQAVALRVTSDRAVIFNCHLHGYQDTLYAHNHRQFYRDCVISGTVDFIFGNAAAVFQNCQILVRKPKAGQGCMVTAQGRTEERLATGFVLQNCNIIGDPANTKGGPPFKAFLGRPWKKFARVLVMSSHIDNVIVPEGWSKWDDKQPFDKVLYGELDNSGPGADMKARVKWPGVKKISPQEGEKFLAKTFIMGDSWIPSTGVPYEPGMIKA